ncbi:MAG TPA: RimK family alpha-L-glutamate ligase [Candidatus Korarchaeota archaeon]|nr:RimK family alpha-L-glutamate ligase [Candidatus Korarchaeota archaeon]
MLLEAAKKRGIRAFHFRFRDIVARIGREPLLQVRGLDVRDVQAVVVRPIGRSSLDQAIFRLDVLYTMEDLGVHVVNSPSAIEKALDKYRSLYLLSRRGIPVPETIVLEDPSLAYEMMRVMPEIVLKPVFGSRGHGSTKVSDRDVAWNILRELAFFRHVLYMQRFIPHRRRDLRAFVVGGEVVAAMIRENPSSWKTNVAVGARPKPVDLSGELEELALKSAEALGCEVAGVDILISEGGEAYVLEVNSQPGWRGIQSVTKVDIAGRIVEYIEETTKR